MRPLPFSKGGLSHRERRVHGRHRLREEACSAILTQKIMKHPDVKASVAAVDEENGVVVLWMNFGDHLYGPGNALITFEAFKVWATRFMSCTPSSARYRVATQRNWPASN